MTPPQVLAQPLSLGDEAEPFTWDKPPNEILVSCKRMMKTHVPYRLEEPGAAAELWPARVCRLH
jgi:hypothetical protein